MRSDLIFPIPSEAEKVIVQLAPIPSITAIIPPRSRVVTVDGLDGDRRRVSVDTPRLAWRRPLGGDGEIELRTISDDGEFVGPYLLGNAWEDGRLCWGDCDVVPDTLKQAHSRFWMAPFNADLWPDKAKHDRDGCPDAHGGHECRYLSCEVSHECSPDNHEHDCRASRRGDRCEVTEHNYRRQSPYNLAFFEVDRRTPRSLVLSILKNDIDYQIRLGNVHLADRRAVLAAWSQGLAPFGRVPSDGCWCRCCLERCRCETGCECCDGQCACLSCSCETGDCDCRNTGCDCCDQNCECDATECGCDLNDRWMSHVANYRASHPNDAKPFVRGTDCIELGKVDAVFVFSHKGLKSSRSILSGDKRKPVIVVPLKRGIRGYTKMETVK